MSQNFGTDKQAALLVSLMRRLHRPGTPPVDAALITKQVLEGSQSYVQEKIRIANKQLNFEPKTSKSTDKQADLIFILETKFWGEMRSKPYLMTYAEADLRIQLMKKYAKQRDNETQATRAAAAQSLAPVINIFTRKSA
jgi:hypothetical protein